MDTATTTPLRTISANEAAARRRGGPTTGKKRAKKRALGVHAATSVSAAPPTSSPQEHYEYSATRGASRTNFLKLLEERLEERDHMASDRYRVISENAQLSKRADDQAAMIDAALVALRKNDALLVQALHTHNTQVSGLKKTIAEQSRVISGHVEARNIAERRVDYLEGENEALTAQLENLECTYKRGLLAACPPTPQREPSLVFNRSSEEDLQFEVSPFMSDEQLVQSDDGGSSANPTPRSVSLNLHEEVFEHEGTAFQPTESTDRYPVTENSSPVSLPTDESKVTAKPRIEVQITPIKSVDMRTDDDVHGGQEKTPFQIFSPQADSTVPTPVRIRKRTRDIQARIVKAREINEKIGILLKKMGQGKSSVTDAPEPTLDLGITPTGEVLELDLPSTPVRLATSPDSCGSRTSGSGSLLTAGGKTGTSNDPEGTLYGITTTVGAQDLDLPSTPVGLIATPEGCRSTETSSFWTTVTHFERGDIPRTPSSLFSVVQESSDRRPTAPFLEGCIFLFTVVWAVFFWPLTILTNRYTFPFDNDVAFVRRNLITMFAPPGGCNEVETDSDTHEKETPASSPLSEASISENVHDPPVGVVASTCITQRLQRRRARKSGARRVASLGPVVIVANRQGRKRKLRRKLIKADLVRQAMSQ